jgi:hypothetical protein
VAIDWSNEPFARLYKRETDDDLLLSWEARAVWHEFLKRCDRSGLLETRRGVQGMAAMLRIPLEVVERVLQELIEDGRMRSVPHRGFIAPNYTGANEATRSDKARQADSRSKRRAAALSTDKQVVENHNPSRDVTSGHAESRDVTTVTHIISEQTHIIDGAAGPLPKPNENKPTDSAKRRSRIPSDWQPRQQERQSAAAQGLDCDKEATQFRDHHTAKGEPMADWDAAFRTWLRNAVSFARRAGRVLTPKSTQAALRLAANDDDDNPTVLADGSLARGAS